MYETFGSPVLDSNPFLSPRVTFLLVTLGCFLRIDTGLRSDCSFLAAAGNSGLRRFLAAGAEGRSFRRWYNTSATKVTAAMPRPASIAMNTPPAIILFVSFIVMSVLNKRQTINIH